MARKMKVRTQLIGSFTLLILFTVIVGFMGIRGINQINYQNRISALASRCLIDAQDAQAASLRFIIYKDSSYMDTAKEEADNVISQAQQAENLMLSEENKLHTQELIQSMEAYEQLNQDYYAVQKRIDNAGEVRAAAAGQVLDNVKQIISFAEDNLRKKQISGMVPASDVEGIWTLQEIRNATNRFRINAQKYQLAVTDSEKESFARSWDQEIGEVESLLLKAKSNFSDDRMTDYLDSSLKSIEEYRENVEVFRTLEDQQNRIQAEQRTEAASVMSHAREVRDGVIEVIDAVTRQNTLLAMLFAILAAATGALIAVILTRSISRQLGGEPWEIVEICNKVSQGDLTMEFPDRKLTGVYKTMREMTERLTEIVNDILTAADQVQTGSEQVSLTSQEISSGTSEQASNMEEVSASMEELSSNIQQNMDNAQQSNTMVKQVSEESREGSHAVSETVDAMKEIAEKINIIEEIARSTNMLALNAAIEAARAGDAGKGFAVVASEVRKLAESSGAAAKEITEISNGSVHRAVAAQEKIQGIVPSMRKTADLVEEISMASKEQNQGAEQINMSVVQLETVVQQNASSSEELASMAEELLSQATSMKSTINYFKVRSSDTTTSETKAKKYIEYTPEAQSSPLKTEEAASAQKTSADRIPSLPVRPEPPVAQAVQPVLKIEEPDMSNADFEEF
ncbi:MAG: methyl-accepting chemotaxis protein [Spirochaetales bacterium]|nr:methyl-accepting chemotaxis protein [Spirochaetales bacterium]